MEIDQDARVSTRSTASIDSSESIAVTSSPNDWLYEVAWEPQPTQQQLDDDRYPQTISALKEYAPVPATEDVLRIGEASSQLQSICGSLALQIA